MTAEEYLKAYIESGHFTYGSPRSVTITQDGKGVLFLRSETSTSAVLKLYELDLTTKQEALLIDLDKVASSQKLSTEEAQLRERLRETAQGITSFTTDRTTTKILCHKGSTAVLFNRNSKKSQLFELQNGAHSLQLSPDGLSIAYVYQGAVWRLSVTNSEVQQVSPRSQKAVSWGSAEFIAAEELSRYKGLWWSPKSDQLLIARVDESAVKKRDIYESQRSTQPSIRMHYPMAGEPNAAIELHVFDLTSGQQTQLRWDNTAFEYLSKVSWDEDGVTIKVIARSQKQAEIIQYNPEQSFKKRIVRKQSHRKWLQSRVDIVVWWQKKLITSEYANGVYCLHVDGEPVMEDINVQAVTGSDDDSLYILGNNPNIPSERHIYKLTNGGYKQITQPGRCYSGVYGNGTLVTSSQSIDQAAKDIVVCDENGETAYIKSNEADVDAPIKVQLHQLGEQKIPTALLLPKDYEDRESIPIIMCPYAGPWIQMVLSASSRYAEAQWFALQGYAVVICDGRGTPGKDEAWEYGVWNNLADPILEDQVTGLREIIKLYPKLDSERVGMRGWSFGGYLSALSVLDRPDVVKAAVAGAPVTDWQLYDTFYSEQFLGLPQQNEEAYKVSSLLNRAHKLQRPLLMIHGVADDNVLVVNAHKFSDAVKQAGKTDLFTMQLLSNQTHMNKDAMSALAVLKSEIDFFNQHLLKQVT
jgi:dipeptidyl-peptidase-4